MLEDSASAIPSSIWASMNSWFTPTVLFLLLNLMIATIAFTSSSFSNHKQQHQNQNQNQDKKHSPIARSPSVLQRLKSINFYSSPPPQDSSLLHHKQIPDSDIQAAHYFFQHLTPQETVEPAHQPQQQPHLVSDQQIARKLQTHFDLEEEKNSSSDDFAGKAVEENHERSMDEVYSQLTDSHFSRTKSDTKPTAGEIPAKLPAKMRKSASVKSAFAHFEEGDIVEARRPATVRERGNARAAEADEEEGVDAKADDFINRFKQQLKLQRLDSIIRYKDMIGRGR